MRKAANEWEDFDEDTDIDGTPECPKCGDSKYIFRSDIALHPNVLPSVAFGQWPNSQLRTWDLFWCALSIRIIDAIGSSIQIAR